MQGLREYKVLSRVFGHQEEQVAEAYRKLFSDLYFSPNIFCQNEIKYEIWAVYAARVIDSTVGNKREKYTVRLLLTST